MCVGQAGHVEVYDFTAGRPGLQNGGAGRAVDPPGEYESEVGEHSTRRNHDKMSFLRRVVASKRREGKKAP